ncbi:hypothetical protein [Streptomyces sp. NPDC097610]|uniref:hypothetical protein n=1 Tax=Streptomyces sp. NPDC097610 TaxID=3157227 RepID=UPI00331B5BF1
MLEWDDEVRDPSELTPKDVTVTDSEIDEALLLVDSMTTDDISGYRDEYRQALEAVIEAKAGGRQPPKPTEEAEEPGGKVVDLKAALQECTAISMVVIAVLPRGRPSRFQML